VVCQDARCTENGRPHASATILNWASGAVKGGASLEDNASSVLQFHSIHRRRDWLVPELPEVETMRRGVLGAMGGVITRAERVIGNLKPILIQPRPHALRRRAVGRAIVDVRRIGKRVALDLDSGDAIVFEPRMTGLLLATEPPDNRYLRFRLDLSGAAFRKLWYWDRRGLGSVRLLSPRLLRLQLGPAKLGPDALSITAEQLRCQLAKSRRAVKVALLDQKALAGVGNLYASEILHVAAMHPAKRCDRLTRAEWRRVHSAMIDVLHDAIRQEGSTLSDGTYRTALNNPGGYQNRHRVYDRAGEPCPSCSGGVIQRIVQAQRSTFFCPACQLRRGLTR
jgi:formamidopyrimidine-DNA glycosylase